LAKIHLRPKEANEGQNDSILYTVKPLHKGHIGLRVEMLTAFGGYFLL